MPAGPSASSRTTPKLTDGGVEVLGNGGRFVAQHIWLRARGNRADHAFNFPVWNMLEKLAPAFLAGAASIVNAGDADVLPSQSGWCVT